MSATFVSSTASASGSTTTTITKPSGATAGDHLIIFSMVNASAVTISGFSSLAFAMPWLSGTNYTHVLIRTLDGSEGSTFTASTATNYIAVLYRGGSTPALINTTQPSASGQTSIPLRSRAPVDGTLVHLFAASTTAPTPGIVAPASGVTSRGGFPSRNFWGVLVCDEVVTAGDDVSRTATCNTSQVLSLSLIIPTSAPVPRVVAQAKNAANSTNASITIPSDAAVGDLFICAFEVIVAGTISAGPSGFTALDGPGVDTGGANASNYWWGYKVLASGDPGSSIHITNASQVWSATGIVIRNVNSTTPVGTKGTLTHGSTTSVTPVAVSASGGGKLAVSALMASAGAGSAQANVDTSSIKGFGWVQIGSVQSGWGETALAVQSVPSGSASLAPTITLIGSPTWDTNTVLINLPATSTSYTGTSSPTVTISTTSAASLGLVGTTAQAVTVGTASTGVRGKLGAATQAVTVGTTSTGVRGKLGAASTALLIAATSSGIVNSGASGSASPTVTISTTLAASLGVAGTASKTVTVGTTSGGVRGTRGSVSKTVAVGTASGGVRGAQGSVSKTVTVGTSSDGVRGKLAGSTRGIIVSATSAGVRGRLSDASSTLILATVASGTVAAGGGPSVTTTDGSAVSLQGWFDGSADNGVTVLGWYDGSTIQGLT